MSSGSQVRPCRSTAGEERTGNCCKGASGSTAAAGAASHAQLLPPPPPSPPRRCQLQDEDPEEKFPTPALVQDRNPACAASSSVTNTVGASAPQSQLSTVSEHRA